MGILIKIILFGLVFYYIFKTIGSFIFKILGGQAQQTQSRQTTNQKRDGEININYVPKDKNGGKGSSSKEGDYIDYEEIK